MEVRQLAEGCQIEQALLLREVELRNRRDGSEYLKLLLGDRTGSVPAVVRDRVQAAREVCRAGEIVHV
ncbi:MAG: hypothetical protein JO372_01695, partial [Solirubrobacterales bacterium]|nr:hypothetical protein [Solirubrobacterales bacterium]